MYRFNWIIFLLVLFSPSFFSINAAYIGEKPLSTTIREDLGQTIKVKKDVQDMKMGWAEQSKTMADQLQT